MDQRAAIPVTLPRENPTRSYWQLEPHEIADMRSTSSLPVKAEVVIIGSGITGAAMAFNLLEKGTRDVIMLEARQTCSGATGRNGTSLFLDIYNVLLETDIAWYRRSYEGSILPLVPRA